jgi:hypothetical protein
MSQAPPIPDSAFTTVMTIVNSVPNRVPITWPVIGWTGAGPAHNWMGDPTMADFASHYWTYLDWHEPYPTGSSVSETWNAIQTAVRSRLAVTQMQTPQMQQVSLTGPFYTKRTTGSQYAPGVDLLQAGSISPESIAFSILYAAAAGMAGVRGYAYDFAHWKDQRANSPVGSGNIQTGADPFAVGVERWQAMSAAFNLIKTIEPYLLQPMMNAEDLGPTIVTGVRSGTNSRLFMALNSLDISQTVAVDLTPYKQGATLDRYRVVGGQSSHVSMSVANSDSVTLAPGETVVWVFQSGGALAAPTITQQPVDVTVTAGQNAAFTVSANGNPLPTYQWQSKASGAGTFTNISGATSTSFTLNNAQLSDDLTQVQCVVTNSQGSATSTPPATLHVNPSPVVITAQPQNTSVVVGQTASFSVTASGSAPVSYQWQSKAPGGVFVNVAGGTSANYTTPITALSDDGTQFKCIVTNGAGPVPSNAATLTVTLSVVAPTIQNQPQPVSITVGQTATFNVAASGSAPLSYQWQYALPGSSSFVNLAGQNTPVYTTPVTTLSYDGYRYRCVVNNSVNAPATSLPATLSVTSSSSGGGGGTTPLQDLDIGGWPSVEPVDGTLNVGYSGDLSSISFTWTIIPKSGSPYGSGTEGVAGMLSRASTANFTVQHSNSGGLAGLNLSPGLYTITVQAFDTSGNSSKAVSKDVTLVYSDLKAVRVFPNPWRKDKHAGKLMTFDHLAYGSAVKIFTVSGHLVKTLNPSNDSVTWDLANDSGDKVASGIYIYLITVGDSGSYGGSGQKLRGKLAVVR